MAVKSIVPDSIHMGQLFDKHTLCCDIINQLKPKWVASAKS